MTIPFCHRHYRFRDGTSACLVVPLLPRFRALRWSLPQPFSHRALEWKATTASIDTNETSKAFVSFLASTGKSHGMVPLFLRTCTGYFDYLFKKRGTWPARSLVFLSTELHGGTMGTRSSHWRARGRLQQTEQRILGGMRAGSQRKRYRAGSLLS